MSMLEALKNAADRLLRLPELRRFEGRAFDAAEVTHVQRRIFASKPILAEFHREYARPFVESAARAPAGARMVEIGSGISMLAGDIPGLICTDLIRSPGIDVACSAYELPFCDRSLDRIFLLFVCHHLGRLERFLEEADRCLKPGGELVIVDPAVTLFSRFYFRFLHFDRMETEGESWGFAGDGRLTDSNVALVWKAFFRDRERLARLHPRFRVGGVDYNTCLAYLLSGGMRIRQLLPTAVLRRLFRAENWLIRNVSRELAVTMAVTVHVD